MPLIQKRDQARRQDQDRIRRPEAIGEALRGRLQVPRLIDEIQDAVKGAVTDRTQDAPLQNAPQIEGASHHRIARGLRHGLRFPRQRGFVAGALTSQHHQVYRCQFAGGDPNHISQFEGLYSHHTFGVADQESCGFRGALQKCIDFTTGPTCGKTLHR